MWTLDETLDYARSQIGVTDGSKYFKIAFGYYSSADWCAAFDSAIKVKGNLDCPYFPSAVAFDKRDLKVIGNRWVEPYNLKAGDFIAFDFDGGGQWGGDHVGIVEKVVGDGSYMTIEGNCGKQVRRKLRTVKSDGIIGGIRPIYKKEVKPLKLTQRGDKGAEVIVIQNLLNLRGITNMHVDGIFGAKTEAGVKAFQKLVGIYPDGKVGAKTWPALTSK